MGHHATSGTPRLLRAGDRGWLVELDRRRVIGVATAIRQQPWSDRVADVVPASATVLVTARTAADMPALERDLAHLLAHSRGEEAPVCSAITVEIGVRYDGPDLTDVATALRMTPAEIARTHSEAEYVVGFFGFAPGFAYIDGLPTALALPRRSEPRVRIDAGYVAIAGEQTVIYPGATPGGWHLIGRTEERLWNPREVPPNRLNIGDRVVFHQLGG